MRGGEIAALRRVSYSAARLMRRAKVAVELLHVLSIDRLRSKETCSGARSIREEFKGIAMRADKTDQSFDAIIHLAAAVIDSK
jgi:hypothetical protein